MLILHNSHPWMPPKIQHLSKISRSKRESIPFPCSWIHSSTLRANTMFNIYRGKFLIINLGFFTIHYLVDLILNGACI
ncbi:hypothetical protein Hanom_Chr17g01589621 [Helianthus anomalus]